MDWNNILQIIISAIVAFLFGKSLYDWFFVKQDKKAREKDNEGKAVETLQKALELIQGQLEKSNADSTEKQAIIVQQQKDLYNERTENAKKTTEIEVLKCRECRRHGCQHREPQTGY